MIYCNRSSVFGLDSSIIKRRCRAFLKYSWVATILSKCSTIIKVSLLQFFTESSILSWNEQLAAITKVYGNHWNEYGTTQTYMATIKSNIATIQTNMTTTQTNMVTIQTNVATIQTYMATIQTNMATAQTNMASAQTKMTITQTNTSNWRYTRIFASLTSSGRIQLRIIYNFRNIFPVKCLSDKECAECANTQLKPLLIWNSQFDEMSPSILHLH